MLRFLGGTAWRDCTKFSLVNGVAAEVGTGMAYTCVRVIIAMKSLPHRRAAAIVFSLLVACALGLIGLLVSTYLWGHFGPPAADADDTNGYLFSLLVGALLGACGIVGSLWMFWPRATKTS